MSGPDRRRAPLPYRGLLRLLPAALRREFGGEMEELFAVRLREAATSRGRMRVWWGAVRDVLGAAAADRFGRRKHDMRFDRQSAAHGGVASGLSFDIRYAVRTLLRAPTYALATVVTLGVGIGVVTALFAVVNGVVLRPLPYRDADRLVLVNSPLLTPSNVSDWTRELGMAEAFGVFGIESGTAITPDGAVIASELQIGRGMLDLLGWRVIEGRPFMAADHEPGAAPVALVSERFWRERFGTAGATGRTLRVADRVYEIVGVLPHDVLLQYDDIDVWVPFETVVPRGASLLVRLPPGVSADAVRERLQPFAERLATPEFRRRYEGMRVSTLTVHRIDDIIVGDVRSTLWLLFAASGLVLLLSALNVANLATTRAQSRASELALRAALGAGRLRLVRHLTVEAAVIAAGGALAGLVLALLTPRLLALAPDYLPRVSDIRIDARVVACAIAVTLASVVVIGVVPGWWQVRRSERTSLHAVVERQRHRRAGQNALVVVEIAVALVLVVGVALLARTYATLRPTAPGFRIDDRVVATFNLPSPKYAEPAAARQFVQELTTALELRTRQDIAITTDLPLTGMSAFVQATRETPEGEPTGVHYRAVSAGYVELMEMRLIAGRTIGSADSRQDIVPIVVNETAARRLWESPDRALGRRTTLDLRGGAVTAEVVGILEDAWALRGPEAEAEVFAPFDRLPSARFRVVIASPRDRPVAERDVRAALGGVDANVPLRDFSTMRELSAWTTIVPRLQATLLGVLSAIALLLAATGCFAVISQMVSQRRRELGIRIALGARGVSIARLILGRVALLAAMGVAAGAVAARLSVRVLESELYGIAVSDTATYLLAAAVLCATVLLATARPLVHALRVDPMRSLRDG